MDHTAIERPDSLMNRENDNNYEPSHSLLDSPENSTSPDFLEDSDDAMSLENISSAFLLSTLTKTDLINVKIPQILRTKLMLQISLVRSLLIQVPASRVYSLDSSRFIIRRFNDQSIPAVTTSWSEC